MIAMSAWYSIGLVSAVWLAAPAAAATHAVTPDGTGDFPTIQAAIDAAVDGDVIELTDGTFVGEGNQGIDFLGKAITVRSQSGDPETCIIDREGAEQRGVVFVSGEGPTSVLEGVTITHGRDTGIYCEGSSPTITDCTVSVNIVENTAGMACVLGSSPNLTGCTFADNRAEVLGGDERSPDGLRRGSPIVGGLYSDATSSPTLTDCVFTENEGYSSGGMSGEGSFTLTGCVFSGNRGLGGSGPHDIPSKGGGLRITGSVSPSVTNCDFSGNGANGGGGMYISGSASPTITNCDFSENYAGSGGGVSISESASPTLADCGFSENRANYGGGMSAWGSASLTLTDCTFLGNEVVTRTSGGRGGEIVVGGRGGALYCGLGTTAALDNCTLSGNNAERSGSGLYCRTDTNVTLARSIIAFGEGKGAIACEDGQTKVTLTCCDIYGNFDGDWVDCIQDQAGRHGNISEDPLFCDWGNGDLTLWSDSPCAPASSPNVRCRLIGAWPVACGKRVDVSSAAPSVITGLRSVSPNPFNPSTTIRFEMVQAGSARVRIYDVAGQLVRSLDLDNQPIGERSIEWDGKDRHGRVVPSGTYMVELEMPGTRDATRVTVIK